MFKNKELVIFDLDETIGLIDADWDVVIEELHEYFLKLGVDWDFTRISGGLDKVYRKFKVGNKVIHEVNALFLRHEMKSIENFKPYPKVVKTIKLLKEKKKLAVCSGNNTKTINACLKIAGLDKDIDFVTGRDSVHFAKPDPEALFLILKHFNAKPQQAVFIGNSYEDRQAAEEAGIDFIDVSEL